ncbi:MAG: hypothetical protein AVDCRST_MAG13-2885, partial [uncultured Solirubrobacteraceae bacterium]
ANRSRGSRPRRTRRGGPRARPGGQPAGRSRHAHGHVGLRRRHGLRRRRPRGAGGPRQRGSRPEHAL